MKILQVAPRYPPYTGGIERHVRELSERLAAQGHDVMVRSTDAAGKYDDRTVNGVTVRRHRAFAPGGAYHLAPGIAAAVRRTDAELVHLHGYHSLPLLFGALGAKEIPVVATPHYIGTRGSAFRRGLLAAYRPFGRFGLRRADRVIAVSEWERARLRTDLGVESTVIPNGVDTDRFVGVEPEVRDAPYLFCIGRLEEYKGVQHAIRALPELPELELLVAGTGPYSDDLRRIAVEEGVADRVTLLGYVEEERVPRLYAGAVAHVTLSEYECYGLTVAESIASGTPCVVRDVTALSEWTDVDGCVGIGSVDPSSVADAIEAAIDTEPNPDDVPDWDEIVERVLGEYRELLE